MIPLQHELFSSFQVVNLNRPMVVSLNQPMVVSLNQPMVVSLNRRRVVNMTGVCNMPQGEKEISYEKLQLILTGISEITEDAEKQSSIIKILVEKKFKDVLQKGFSDDEIIEQSKTFAKTTLEKNLDELSEKHSVLDGKFESHKTVATVKIEGLEAKTDEQGIQLSTKEKEVEKLKAELKIKTVKEEIANWQKRAYWLIPVGVLIVLFTILQFCCIDWTYNYSYKCIEAIDTMGSETQKSSLRALMYAPIIGLWIICTICWNQLGSSEKKEEKKKELEKEFDEKHK